jgi:hypothetical protein
MQRKWILLVAAASLGACSAGEEPETAAAVDAATAAAAPAGPPSFRGDVPMKILMQGPVTLAAEVYWDSVKIVVDIEGEHIYQPETDEDWHVVWQAGIAIAESANLLMDDERALDQGDWLTMSNALYDAGLSAARAAEAKDYEAVLAEGETVYNACTACHEQYMPTVNL